MSSHNQAPDMHSMISLMFPRFKSSGMLMLCSFLVSALSLYAPNESAAQGISPLSVTPSVPGIVYIQFRSGSQYQPQSRQKQQIKIGSISGSRYEKVLHTIGATSIVPFDADASHNSISRKCGIDRMFVVSFTKVVRPIEAVNLFLASGEVVASSPRYMFPVSKLTNDPDLSQQYALGQSVMNVEGAWDVTTGSSSIVLADVDEGVNYNHEDLAANMVSSAPHGYDVVTGQNDALPGNTSLNHGTETSGCMSAVGNNGLGGAGVAYGCKLLAIRADAGADNIVGGYEGVNYALTHGARVVNCSWGGQIDPQSLSYADALVSEANYYNAVIVAASGNNTVNIDNTPFYPACVPGVFTVGATDENDQPAGFTDYGNRVNVYAPGVNVFTTTWPGNDQYTGGANGTSFACPLVAGVVALMMSAHPDWPVRIIEQQIINTCDPIQGTTDRHNFWGRVNAAAALSTPTLPGLGITSFSVNGSGAGMIDTVGHTSTLLLTLKNFVGAGQNLSITLLPSTGVGVQQPTVQLNSMAAEATRAITYTLSRSAEFSYGQLPLYFYVTDNNTYHDTLTIQVPLKPQYGFYFVDSLSWCTSVKQSTSQSAWIAHGFDDGVQTWSDFSFESGGSWNPNIGYVARNTGDTISTGAWCVESLDDQTAWFGVTSLTNAFPPLISKTPDNGSTWVNKDVSAITPYINSIHFFDPKNGIFIGDPKSNNWGIAFSHDGGTTWNPTNLPVAALGGELGWKNSICWVRNNGWFGTNKAQVYRTTNGGLRWSTSNVVSNCVGIGFDDDSLHGFAVCRPATKSLTAGAAGVNALELSTDGGATWNKISMPLSGASPSDVKFVPTTHIAILVANTGVYRTSDFGKTWTTLAIPTFWNGNQGAISIATDNGQFAATAVSAYGGVSYGEPVTVEGVATSKNAIASTVLLQNAPNPFSTTTQIFFTQSQREHVALRIYDALGRAVSTLLDATLAPGQHSATLNAEHLPSGVYQYVLETESGVRVARRMTIVK